MAKKGYLQNLMYLQQIFKKQWAVNENTEYRIFTVKMREDTESDWEEYDIRGFFSDKDVEELRHLYPNNNQVLIYVKTINLLAIKEIFKERFKKDPAAAEEYINKGHKWLDAELECIPTRECPEDTLFHLQFLILADFPYKRTPYGFMFGKKGHDWHEDDDTLFAYRLNNSTEYHSFSDLVETYYPRNRYCNIDEWREWVEKESAVPMHFEAITVFDFEEELQIEFVPEVIRKKQEGCILTTPEAFLNDYCHWLVFCDLPDDYQRILNDAFYDALEAA